MESSRLSEDFSRWWFQICFIFTPIPGEMIQCDLRIILEMDGENHQPVLILLIGFTVSVQEFPRLFFLFGGYFPLNPGCLITGSL